MLADKLGFSSIIVDTGDALRRFPNEGTLKMDIKRNGSVL